METSLVHTIDKATGWIDHMTIFKNLLVVFHKQGDLREYDTKTFSLIYRNKTNRDRDKIDYINLE